MTGFHPLQSQSDLKGFIESLIHRFNYSDLQYVKQSKLMTLTPQFSRTQYVPNIGEVPIKCLLHTMNEVIYSSL